MLLFVLLLSLGHPMSVSADDGTPPSATEEPAQPPVEEEEPEAAPPPTEESAPPLTEAPVVQETAATEAPAATEVPVEEVVGVSPIAESEGEEVSDEPGAIEELTVGEVLEAAPEDTQVVVLDENGEALPLVSTEAAEIVATADPMWCPVIAGVPTLPGGAGCSPNFGTSQALIDNMDVTDPQTPGLGLYEQPGIIYFTADLTDPGNSFILTRGGLDDDVAWPELYDADYDALKGYDLILQGGWSGVNGDTNFTQTDFGANHIQIGTDTNPWVGNITINDITINGAADIGLTVYTQGDINLDHVTANENTFIGADLNSAGNINIRSSTFGGGAGSGNDFAGLYTSAAGSTTLVGVTASGNGIFGAILSNPAGVGGPITVSESHFDRNVGGGLLVGSNSSITLANVTASDNGGLMFAGANLISAGPLTVTGSHFDGNDTGGLLVQSLFSNVSLSGVTANDNGLFGAMVNAVGTVWVSNSYFDGNTDPLGEAVGLAIGSDQSITLDHVSASNNLIGDGVGLSTFENATIICSQFQNNAGVGVDGIAVDGAFTLNDVTFGGNGMDYDGTPVIMGGGCKVVVAGKGAGAKPSSHSLSLHIVPVIGGEQAELDCGAYSGTKLILPNGDQVILPCPIKDQGVLTGKGQDQLPAPLGAGFAFASGLEVQVLRGGESLDQTNAGMTIDFLIPDGMADANLAILRWDEEAAQWVESPGGIKTGDDHFLANSQYTGIYVLVTK
jgi:hypothetical protein